ncbi:NDRG family protein [Gracilaria domingensis]|nr:NDRG family protein [Gracilaria domingensis]
MSNHDAGFFNVVVESQPGVQTLEVPHDWTTDTFLVRDVTVQVHIRPRESGKTVGPPILTFHDVGQNAAIAFGPFFSNFRRVHPHIDTASAHYHLTAPGHLPDEPDCGANVGFGVDDMVSAVLELIDRMQIPRLVAFGIGLGAAVLVQAAATRPKAFAGLILISPVFHPATRFERLGTSVEGFFSKNLGFGLTQRTKDRFLYRWLSDDIRESNFSVSQSLEEGLDRLNSRNVLRFFETDMWRTGVEQCISDVKAKVLLITGKESALREHTADLFASFDPETTSWVDIIDSGSLAHDEFPEKVAESVSLFLQGFTGYC